MHKPPECSRARREWEIPAHGREGHWRQPQREDGRASWRIAPSAARSIHQHQYSGLLSGLYPFLKPAIFGAWFLELGGHFRQGFEEVAARLRTRLHGTQIGRAHV